MRPSWWALDRVDAGGQVHAFAGTPSGALIDANVVHYRHLSLVGSTGSTVGDYRRALAMARARTLPIDRMPRAEVALDAVPAILLEDEPDPRFLKFVVVPREG